jgi:thioredoxin reductase (NADPH)
MLYDVIIIGGGPAGLSAGVYASRARLKTLLIEKKGCGGQMMLTDSVENYPGFKGGISGFDLAIQFETQARDFGTEIVYDKVLAVEGCGLIKKIITINTIYKTKTIIIAAGTVVKKMNIPGESNFIGKGISFCAICDAPFYRDKDILVIGGGDSAIQEAVYLSKFAKSVTIVYRKNKLRATKILQERMISYSNISVIYDSVVQTVSGENFLEKVRIVNVKTRENMDLKVAGVFVFIGLIPNTSFIQDILLDETGYIVTDEAMCTSLVGVFSCGDIRKKFLRQIVTAVADGAQAAISAQHYIEGL